MSPRNGNLFVIELWSFLCWIFWFFLHKFLLQMLVHRERMRISAQKNIQRVLWKKKNRWRVYLSSIFSATLEIFILCIFTVVKFIILLKCLHFAVCGLQKDRFASSSQKTLRAQFSTWIFFPSKKYIHTKGEIEKFQ